MALIYVHSVAGLSYMVIATTDLSEIRDGYSLLDPDQYDLDEDFVVWAVNHLERKSADINMLRFDPADLSANRIFKRLGP